ncbi:MAG: hypothetical protein ACLPWF_04625 [Bryobacteraceae bacterium]
MSLLGGLGALTGLFANSPANRTTTTSGTGTTSSSGTSTVGQNLTPGQTGLSNTIYPLLQSLMTPSGAQAAIAPFTAASMDATNSTYGGLANTLRSQFLSTGNGQSGKYGTGLVQGNLQRLGSLQQVQNTGQEEAAALPLQAESVASGLLEHPFGYSSTTSNTGSNTYNGTTVGPGSELAGALEGGFAGLSSGSNELATLLGQMNGSGDSGGGFASLGIPSQIGSPPTTSSYTGLE